ncbi:MAG: hypothetical protein IJ829_00230, partial [Kiritimatiellae bacterium]|nr:hypothetical protein [Kiritimatiellia bacterium]
PGAPRPPFGRGAARFALAAGARIAVCRIGYDPPVLGKNQPWWDVGDRRIMVQLRYCGELPADGPCNYRNAVATTEKIKEMMK